MIPIYNKPRRHCMYNLLNNPHTNLRKTLLPLHNPIRLPNVPKPPNPLINSRPHPPLLNKPIHLLNLLPRSQHHPPHHTSIHQTLQQRRFLHRVLRSPAQNSRDRNQAFGPDSFDGLRESREPADVDDQVHAFFVGSDLFGGFAPVGVRL